jgi:hypothetical protein
MPKFYTLYQKNLDPINQVPIIVDDNLSMILLDRSSDWDVSVVNFSIPNMATPLFKFVDDTYWMGLSYGSNFTYLPIVFDFLGVTNNPKQELWDISPFVFMMNTTLKNLYAQYNSTYGALPSTNIPYFYYNPETELFELIAEKAFYESTLTTPIKILINDRLLTKIPGYPLGGPFTYTHGSLDDKFWSLTLLDFTLNQKVIGGVTYLSVISQGAYLDNMIDIEGLVIQTNMPINFEQSRSSTGLPILTSFSLNDIDIKQFRNRIVYNTTVPYRQYALRNDEALKSVSCSIYSTDGVGNITPILLPYGESASIKLMFTERRVNKYA